MLTNLIHNSVILEKCRHERSNQHIINKFKNGQYVDTYYVIMFYILFFLVTNIIFLFFTYMKIFSVNTIFFVSNSKTDWLFKLISV